MFSKKIFIGEMKIENYLMKNFRTVLRDRYYSNYFKLVSALLAGVILVSKDIFQSTFCMTELRYRDINISVVQLWRLVKVNLNLQDTYHFEYYKVSIFMLLTLLVCSLLILIAYLFSLTTLKDSEKLSEYECGFEPFDNATRHPFDVHFYIVGILFLIFDVEIALIFPWVMALDFIGWFSFLNMTLFLIIVTIGFFYEWHRGALSWPQIPDNSIQ